LKHFEVMESIVIRKIRECDCDEVFEMIKELAAVENMSSQVKITAETLKRDGGFKKGSRPYYHAFVAYDNNKSQVIGYSIFVYHFSMVHGKSIHLEDFFVRETYRHKGVGSKMLNEVAKFGELNKCRGLYLHCLEWNCGPMEMYKRRGAVNITEKEGWHILRFNSQEFKDLISS